MRYTMWATRLRFITSLITSLPFFQVCEKYIHTMTILNDNSIGNSVWIAYIGVGAHRSFPMIIPPRIEPILDIDDLSSWMMVPLLTAERIMFLDWPEETKGFACMTLPRRKLITRSSETEDSGLYREMWYQKQLRDDADDEVFFKSTCKVVILSLMPWAMTATDMEEFIKTPPLPLCNLPIGGTSDQTFNQSQSVWAKISVWVHILAWYYDWQAVVKIAFRDLRSEELSFLCCHNVWAVEIWYLHRWYVHYLIHFLIIPRIPQYYH